MKQYEVIELNTDLIWLIKADNETQAKERFLEIKGLSKFDNNDTMIIERIRR